MRSRTLALVLSLAVAVPASAQGFMGEMHRDVNEVQKKMVDIAELNASFMHLHQAMGLITEQVEETMVDGR